MTPSIPLRQNVIGQAEGGEQSNAMRRLIPATLSSNFTDPGIDQSRTSLNVLGPLRRAKHIRFSVDGDPDPGHGFTRLTVSRITHPCSSR
jgi:hypothetical protein